MKVNVSFHNVDKSQALTSFIKQKSQKLSKFMKGNDNLRWVVDKDNHQFNSRLHLSLKGKRISVNSQAQNAFMAVSDSLAKAKRLLSQRHEGPIHSH